MTDSPLRVLVLAGGPDRERPVSLLSGATVAAALRQAGHETIERDILPSQLDALDEFAHWHGDVIFPALHGAWGEGGGLQAILDARHVPYVGCRSASAQLCMDKTLSKTVLHRHGLPTPAWQLLTPGAPCTIAPPLVLKPPREGSSIDVVICRDDKQFSAAREQLHARHPELLAEAFIEGKELTVGVLQIPTPGPARHESLPPIQIIPATDFYDYEAKYERNDTRYLLDPVQIGLPPDLYNRLGTLAVEAHEALGCRHFSRVDIMVDHKQRPWILEDNTIPGFTSHSLLPMAAAHAGIALPTLVDRLVRLAAAE